VRVGTGATSFVAERNVFGGKHLHPMYDTRQIFAPRADAATFTQLHPYYFTGLPQKKKERPKPVVREWPASVRQLPPELRWQIAARLFTASPAMPRNVIRFPRTIAKPHTGRPVSGDAAPVLRIVRADCA
jgi:hypothetical protein